MTGCPRTERSKERSATAQLAPMLPSPRNSPASLHPARTQRVNSAVVVAAPVKAAGLGSITRHSDYLSALPACPTRGGLLNGFEGNTLGAFQRQLDHMIERLAVRR